MPRPAKRTKWHLYEERREVYLIDFEDKCGLQPGFDDDILTDIPPELVLQYRGAFNMWQEVQKKLKELKKD